jgi:hypothetical protein
MVELKQTQNLTLEPWSNLPSTMGETSKVPLRDEWVHVVPSGTSDSLDET